MRMLASDRTDIQRQVPPFLRLRKNEDSPPEIFGQILYAWQYSKEPGHHSVVLHSSVVADQADATTPDGPDTMLYLQAYETQYLMPERMIRP